MQRCSKSVAAVAIFCQLLWSFAAIVPPEVSAGSGDLVSLVAPIALYPDPLLAQVLVASTNLGQVDAASEWVDDHPDLKGDALTKAVRNKNWDPGIKGLVHFPGVLEDLGSNRGWSAALGAAYTHDPGSVMRAIQSLRLRAQDAGKLRSNPEIKVVHQKQTIVIEPANPKVVYVPSYNPTLVYGAPVAVYPGYSGATLAMTGVLSFGAGVALGALAFGGLGFGGWGVGWSSNSVTVNNSTYSASNHSYSSNETNPSSHNAGEESKGAQEKESETSGAESGSEPGEHQGAGPETEHGSGEMHGAEAGGDEEREGGGEHSGAEGESAGGEHGGGESAGEHGD